MKGFRRLGADARDRQRKAAEALLANYSLGYLKHDQAVIALIELGYTRAQAERMLRRADKEVPKRP